jgi:aromatic-L-amino-acid/L-tryptophan decarboxylase
MIQSSFLDNIQLFRQISQFEKHAQRKVGKQEPDLSELAKLEQVSRKLEPDQDQRFDMVETAGRYASDFINSLSDSDGSAVADISNLRSMSFSDEPKELTPLLNLMAAEVDKGGINPASGRDMGYIPGGGIFTSAISDFLAAATNRFATLAYSNPGAVEIENQVLRWMISLIGFPPAAHGNLTSGGSIANLIAIKAARDAKGINSGNVKNSVVYLGAHTHHCVAKALNITGMHEAIVRIIPANDSCQMDTTALLRTIEQDVEHGLNPFLVVGTAGSTDLGSIDPLNEIAAICKQHSAWFHVDAAYGGFFMLVDDVRGRFRGIENSSNRIWLKHLI